MPCFKPLKGWRSRIASPSGKRRIVFDVNEGYADLPVTVPCGQCSGCRLERSRQWAVRCVHESQMHQENAFITLTFNDDHLPSNYSLDVAHWQKFMKRLKSRVRRKSGKAAADRIKFYHCGEYGPKYYRPHYHACLFGFDFGDKKLWRVQNDQPLFTSEYLSELWPYGYSSVGSVTFQSAAYVARYIMKKITGDQADNHYDIVNLETGEITRQKPEYVTMSNGIGKSWLERYKDDVYNGDFVVMNGKKMRPPRYYDTWYEAQFPSDFQRLKASRRSSIKEHADNNTPARLKVREKILDAKINLLPREVE